MTKKPHRRRRVIANVFGTKLQFFIRFVSWSLFAIVALAAIAMNVEFWLLEIYVSFIPQIFMFAVTLFIVLVALYGRFIIRDGWSTCWRFIGISDVAMFLGSSFFTVYIATSSLTIIDTVPQNSIAHNITVGSYNMLYKNDEIYNAAYFFKSNDAEIVALQEASPEFVEEAREILGYEYVEITDCDCSAGDTEVAIISMYPLSNTSVISKHDNGAIVRSEAIIDGDTTIAVYALHIPPPYNSQWYKLRNEFMDQLSKSIENDDHRSVIMGDFNTTIFSPVMQQFIGNSRSLIDNMSETAWPECTWNGFSDIACTHIDHIFASRQFGVGQRYIGPGFGSDHKPQAVELLVN